MDEIIYKNKNGKTLIKIFKDTVFIDEELEKKEKKEEVLDEDDQGKVLRGNSGDNSA